MLSAYKHMFMYEYVHMWVQSPWRPEEGAESSIVRDTGGCELPDVGAGNQM